MSNSNPMPIYSHVVPKSQQYRSSKTKNGTRERNSNLPRDFDPLNYNNGGQFIGETKEQRERRKEEKEVRKKEDAKAKRSTTKNDSSEGKVEAYLRQNQVSIRQQQHRHSAVRQAEHRVNLRSLPLNDIAAPRSHDRTPDRHRVFPERERDGTTERRRERNKERDNVDGVQPSPTRPPKQDRDPTRPVRKSSSSHKISEATICTTNRRFFCREWLFQKIAHCLEQRSGSKTCGTLILGEAGSGKTAICRELSEPGQGAQGRQQRALNRRMLARHFLQANAESSKRPGEFIRSLAMQILSHSDQHKHRNKHADDSGRSPDNERARRVTDVENLVRRFKDLTNDGDTEDSSKPLLADSEDQRTDEEGDMSALPWHRRTRTINRIHESKDYMDCMSDPDFRVDELPQILPRHSLTTNPFLTDDQQKDSENRVYENHENLFLRNVSQKPQIDKKTGLHKTAEQKTDSETDKSEKTSKIESSPPKSRIPVSKFKSPYKTDIKTSSNESSPQKKNINIDTSSIDTTNIDTSNIDTSNIETKMDIDTSVDASNGNVIEDELPEYQNVLKEDERREMCDVASLVDKKRTESDDVPPPIPSLPVSPRTLIANAYYEKLLSDPEIQQALLPQNLEKNPDECFKRAILFPLLEIDPPKQSLFWLIDAIDEGLHGQSKADKDDSTQPSTSVCVLIARHQHLLPQWLLLLPTARSHSKQITHMFTGCRKIVLDDLQRAHVSADVQRYVLARLDTEPKLRSRVSSDSAAAAAAAAALDHLRIKSDGCMLYLEKVLDGVADGFIALREIKEIPGTLNGLYLWLAQRLFHGRRFTKVRLLLDVLLAARCGVTEEMLYKCLLTKECNVTRDDFNRRLHLLRRILVIDPSTNYLSIFHHSFSRWLVDVKHCTRRYLCSPGEGHGALAMYYTLDAHRLSPLEIHNYVLHITHLEEYLLSQKKGKNSKEPEVLDMHTLILLWVLDSGCDVESALKRDTKFDSALAQIKESDENVCEDELDAKAPDAALNPSPLNTIMPSLIAGWSDSEWPRDNQVLEALLQLTQTNDVVGDTEPKSDPQEEITTVTEEMTEELTESLSVDPTLIHELANKGDDDALTAIIKRYPTLIESQDGTGGTALHTAARAGKASTTALLLKAGADINSKDADGWTPLRAAAWAGHTEVVDVLLEHGCEVDCVDADNRTALRAAAWSGHEAVVEALVAAGADPNLADCEGRTPLIAAAYMSHVHIVETLLQRGANTEHADNDGRTALSVAALSSSGLACISVLIDHGANVNVPDKDGATPLIVAAFEGHTAICEALLEAGADVEAAGGVGRGALWAAAAASHAQVARLTLYWGARVDHMDEDGRTVLAVAAAHGNAEVVRQLLDRGLDENHRDNSGWTPLHYAAFEGHVEVCAALLEAGARIEEVENDGKSAVMVAAGEGHCEVISLLAEWGADLNRVAHDATTASRLAALEGHIPCVHLLHSLGCCVDVCDAEQRSTLYVLALDNRLEMAEFLMRECGAKVTTRDTEGRTPLHVAAWQGHAEMIELLITVGGAMVGARDRCGRSALHCAAWRGRATALAALVRRGADTRAQCTQGASPLGIAAQEGHEECVLLLLQHGADPLQADHCGRTPAKVAWRAGHVNICRLLEAHAASSAPSAPISTEHHIQLLNNSPEYKRRSVHSSNSTKCSSNLTAGSNRSHDRDHADLLPNRSNLSLSFVQQVARCGRGRRDKDKVIPERRIIEQDDRLRSYMGAEGDSALQGSCSPLYVSPPRSPVDPDVFGTGSQPASLPMQDTHFNRDTHMRIILGRECKQPPPKNEASVRSIGSYKRLVGTLKRARGRILKQSKNKRNGIVTNPALRLVANVKNGLDHAAANIRRTGVALAASASSSNPVVKTNAFQWRKETPL